ncbi:MAG: RluA family pseudouridine synthase [Planctomycetia bacterium]|nr:RluA family pseudouridine synthase [Planctomycetia bacterium]
MSDYFDEESNDDIEPTPNLSQRQTRQVEHDQSGWRLDKFLVYHFPDYSRTLLRGAIMSGCVLVDGKQGKPAYKLNPGQMVAILLPERPRETPAAEDIPLDVLYEDSWVVAINKPPGMVTHPARGHWSGTLTSALQFRFGMDLSQAGGPTRPGIVHRLDRDTSGVILVARNDQAHAELARQFEQRIVQKEYFAIAYGNPLRDCDWIDAPIGPHPRHREKKMIRFDSNEAREARTFYEVDRRFAGFSSFKCFPKTGRTHQIRLHLAHVGHPIVGDLLYSSHPRVLLGELRRDRNLVGISHDDALPLPPETEDFREYSWDDAPPNRLVLARQALHARRIRFLHPRTHEEMEIEAPLPTDLERFLFLLEKYRKLD